MRHRRPISPVLAGSCGCDAPSGSCPHAPGGGHHHHHHHHRRRARRGRLTAPLSPGTLLPAEDTVLLVGSLKTGKSTLFSRLVGRRQHELSVAGLHGELTWGLLRGTGRRGPALLDAPGVYALHDRSEEARALRELMLMGHVGTVLLVLDAKNLRRGLALCCQVAAFGLPVVVALNMSDEARLRGQVVDEAALSELLGVPVVPTVAVEGQGLGQLRRALREARPLAPSPAHPPALAPLARCLEQAVARATVPPRALAYLALCDLPEVDGYLEATLPAEDLPGARACLAEPPPGDPRPRDIQVTETELARAEAMAQRVVRVRPPRGGRIMDRLAVWTRRPLTGLPIAALVLLLLYLFVGELGAGMLVELLEGRLFGEVVLPAIGRWVEPIPWAWLRDLLVGRFGLISVGIVLWIGIVTPVLATFFVAFAILEDSGYLQRLALLADRSLRHIGLNGRGVLPLLMGFSCVTMALLTTRVLDRRKQRIIATLLLMTAFPCAPLLSVMMVMLARLSPWATVVVFATLLLNFLVVGVVANRVLPGRRQDFILELPPLRAPRPGNVLLKAGHRLLWFLREAIPYFLIGTFALYLLDIAGLLDGLRDVMRPVLVWGLGLPRESAEVFLMTVLRREAGAALLVHQAEAGLYDGVQAVVTLTVMTLIVPCINTVLIMFKEQGARVSMAILVFVMGYGLLVGAGLGAVLRAGGASF